MFTRSKDLRDLQEIAERAQALVRQQLVRDFIAHLEEEHRFVTACIDEGERPSILVWLGQVGGYYAMVEDRYNVSAQLNAVHTYVRGVFEWEEFAVHLDHALNEKYGGKTPERLTIEPAVRDEKSRFLDREILRFSYDPHYAWGD